MRVLLCMYKHDIYIYGYTYINIYLCIIYQLWSPNVWGHLRLRHTQPTIRAVYCAAAPSAAPGSWGMGCTWQTDGLNNGRTDGRTDGRMDGWMDGWMGIYGESMINSWNIWRIYENIREIKRIYGKSVGSSENIQHEKNTIKTIDKSSSTIYFYGPCLP